MSLPAWLKKEVKRVPLPESVTWSDVFQILMLGAIADQKKWTREQLLSEVYKHPQGKVIRAWLLERYDDFLQD